MRITLGLRYFVMMSVALGGAAIARAELVALYKFDETSGNIARDSAQNDGIQDAIANQGTPGWVAGKIGGAIDLDGATSLLAPDAIGALPTEGDPAEGENRPGITISMWVNLDDPTITLQGLVTNRTNGLWGINLRNQQSDANPANLKYQYNWDHQAGSSGGTGVFSDPGTAVADTWQHVALTWRSTGSSTARGNVYLNGQDVGDSPFMSHRLYEAVGSMWHIGDDPCCSGREFDGQLDDLAFWNEELSAAQIEAIYDDGLGGIGIPAPVRPTLPGDVNNSGNVNRTDIVVIRDNLFQEFTDVADGDLINDDFIDFLDYGDWKQVSPKAADNLPISGSQVPEPSTLAVLGVVLGWAGLSLRRR